jgi:tRNA-modifying protein YgfZ
MTEPSALCLLADLGALRLRGSDTRGFLQGQVSSDVTQLAPDTLQRAGLHNPQGRTLALLSLIAEGEQDVLVLLPRELLPNIAALLRRYVLRSKVVISDESEALRIYGRHERSASGESGVRYDAQRSLIIEPPRSSPRPATLMRERWRALDIAAGLPQVYAATSGQFVAQMLNLDCIGAVAFDKGCYTGQEIIARAQHLVRIKRRMFRLRLASRGGSIGGAVKLADGRSGRLTELAPADGHLEALAVLNLEAGAAGERAPGERAPGERAPGERAPGERAPGDPAPADAAAPGAPAAGDAADALELPLPYSFKDR